MHTIQCYKNISNRVKKVKAAQLPSFTILAAMLFLLACTKVSYKGSYSKEGFYAAPHTAYFYYPTPADTLIRYSFITRWIEEKRQVIQIPVKITGLPANKPLTFKVSVNEKESTAKPNVHYTPLAAEFHIPADSLTGYVPVEVWRDHLSSTTKDTILLVLQLEDSKDLKAAFYENRKVSIAMDDFLEAPYFWMYYKNYWGPYTQVKYRKFLSYFNGDPKKLEEALLNDFDGLSIKFIEVYNFFMAHPEYHQEFPPTIYRPYK